MKVFNICLSLHCLSHTIRHCYSYYDSDNCDIYGNFVFESRFVFVAFFLVATTTAIVIAFKICPSVELSMKWYFVDFAARTSDVVISTIFIGIFN